MHTPEQGYSLPTGQGTSHSGVQEVFYWVYIKKGFGKGKKRLPWFNNILKDFIIFYNRAQDDTGCPFCLHLGKPTRLEVA